MQRPAGRHHLKKVLGGLVAALLVSMPIPQLASANQTPSDPSSVNWTTMNSDADHSNYVAQNQIGASNVKDLSLAWSYSFPISPEVPGLNVTGQGAIAPPLVVNGTVYEVTNYLTVYAFNGETGAIIWSYAAQLNDTGLPLAPLTGHIHGINYYRGNIWFSLPDCSVVALNAETGTVSETITDICANIPGNAGLYDSSGVPPVFTGDTMIWVSSVSEGTNVGRGFVAAYNITDGSLLWRWYVSPPDTGNPNWDVDSCSINATSSCHGNVTPYPGDWGTLGTIRQVDGTVSQTLAGAGPGFGDPVTDSKHGLVFVATSQASPDWNGTYRPGPDLYADSIVALNLTNGHMLWFYQTTPHDLYDFDCGWNTILGNVTQGGVTQEAVFKSCKNGYVYALGAVSGNLLWYYDPPAVVRENTENANYVASGNYSATLPWLNYPSTTPFRQCPGENGAIESDMAFAYSMVFVATYNLCSDGVIGPVATEGSGVIGATYLEPDSPANTTIYGIDASTGKQVWSYLIPAYPYRGWVTATNGLIFAGSASGDIYVLNAKTGAYVTKVHVGPALFTSPTLGTAADGRVFLYELVAATEYGGLSGPLPGSLMAYSLPAGSQTGQFPIAGLVLVGAATVVVVAGFLFARARKRNRSPG